jgi:uridine kinase
MTSIKRTFVTGISSISGGGKTAVAQRLAELLQDAVTVCFDDYDDTNVHPDNLEA